MVLYKKILTSLFVGHCCILAFFLSPSFGKCFSTVWPHEQSDLQPDPSLVFGRLENGFRYVLKKNTEPKNRVAMSLNIQAGSLNETDEQRGIAHFLEHMLFNGSTHFPPGELIEYFQSIGMSFGGDTNAHTSYDETVYDIILPEGSAEDIQKGLLVFSDYARGALLLQTEIDRERGVILAEKRSRDSAAYRAHVKETEFSMKGTRLPERMPIGVLKTLNGANHTIMKNFYDAWYRPDNMVLVMVGDFEPQVVQPLIEKQFAALVGPGEKSECPEFGQLNHDGLETFYHHEGEMGTTETSLESMWSVQPEDDSAALQKENLTRYVASTILQHRLDDLSRRSDTPFTSAQTYSGVFMNRIAYASIGVKSDPAKWKQSLTVIENSLRQALVYGFTKDELSRVQKELLAEFDSDVLTASSRNSKTLTGNVIRNINRNRVMQSPEQERELLAPVLLQMSLADVEKSFRESWANANRMVKVNGNAVIEGDAPEVLIAAVYESAAKKTVAAYKGEELQAFPYLQLHNTQELQSQEEFTEIDAKRFVFANNVVLNLKKTSFQENELHIAADFGLGQSSEPVPGLGSLGEAVIAQSGTATLSKSALDRIIAGSSVELGFQLNPLAFSWQGKALKKDMELLFQLVQSVLADPGIDDDAFQVSMERFKQAYVGMASDVRGVMMLQGESFLAGENPFFGYPPWSELSKLKSEQIADWIFPAAQNGALEISIVGDFDEKEVIRLAEKYFSVLPERTAHPMREVDVSFPEGETLTLSFSSSIDKGMLVLAWKTDDFWDINQTRALHLLAEIFSDKMRRVIREKLGATYSPQVYNASSRIYKGYGVMRAVLIVDPAQIKLLKKEVLRIAEEIWQGTISEEELERAKGPMLTSLKDMVRTNRYWLNSVLGLSQRYPQQLQWPQSILSGFENVSLREIQELGKLYLDPKKTAVINVVPE